MLKAHIRARENTHTRAIREHVFSMLRLFSLERDERASGKSEYIADLNNNKYRLITFTKFDYENVRARILTLTRSDGKFREPREVCALSDEQWPCIGG